MQPRNRLACPNAGPVPISKFLGNLSQNGVIVAGTVLRHSPPVHCFRSEVSIGKASDHTATPLFGSGIFLPHERDAPKPIHQSCIEIIVRQIAFKAYTFLAIAIEQEDRRCPDCTKAVEPSRVFLDMSSDGKEVFMDELGGPLICIRLGIQPSISASSWSRAEIQQDRAGFLLGRR
jgi:hypothetical protein